MKFGLLADTHIPGSMKELWPQVADAFKGVDLILHGGDITSSGVLDWLERIAPVVAAEGNHDVGMPPDPRVKRTHRFNVDGYQIGLIHMFEPAGWPVEQLMRLHFGSLLDVVVFADTHYEVAEVRDDVLVVNPGSPTYPHNMETRLGTIGFLEINGQGAQAQIFQLHKTPRLTLLQSASIIKSS